MRFHSPHNGALPGHRRGLRTAGRLAFVCCVLWTAALLWVDLPQSKRRTKVQSDVSVTLAIPRAPAPVATPVAPALPIPDTTPEPDARAARAPSIEYSDSGASPQSNPRASESEVLGQPSSKAFPQPLALHAPTEAERQQPLGFTDLPPAPRLGFERGGAEKKFDRAAPYVSVFGQVERRISEDCVLREDVHRLPVSHAEIVVHHRWCQNAGNRKMDAHFEALAEHQRQRRQPTRTER